MLIVKTMRIAFIPMHCEISLGKKTFLATQSIISHVTKDVEPQVCTSVRQQNSIIQAE
jgi:hypothetical protein